MTSIALRTNDWSLQDVRATSPKIDFETLVADHSRDLYRYAYWLSGDRHTAEDLVQETLLRAYKSLHRLKESDAIKGWLITILRRENARRFERLQPRFSEQPPEALEDPAPDYDTSTEAFVLRRALKRLPAEYLEPLLLQVIGGLSQKEIGEQLGLSSAGVGTRLFRARQKLREMLVQEDG